MSIRSGQSITTEFTTRRVDTGAATNADSTPTGTIYVNGTADAATVTVTNITTGLYKAAITMPTLAVGDVVSLIISATVNSISDKSKVWEDTKDFAIDSSGRAIAHDARGGNVYVVTHDGNNSTSGSTLISTVGAASAPATVYVSAGTFALGTTQLDIPAGVHIQCAGVDKTFITSSKVWTSGSQYAQIHLNTGCSIDGFTHTSSNNPISGSNYDFPIGCGLADAAFLNATVSNFKILAGTDGIYIKNASTCSLTIRNGLIRTAWDTIVCQAGGGVYTLDIDNVLAINEEANSTGVSYGLQMSGATGSVVRANNFRNIIVTRGAGTTNYIAWIALTNSTGYFHACSQDVYGTSTLSYTVVETTAHAELVNCDYDRTKVSGSPTDYYTPLRPTTAGRTLDVSATGEAGLDWANVGSPTTSVNLSGTSTKALEPTTAGRTLDVAATGTAGIDWSNIDNKTSTANLTNTTVSGGGGGGGSSGPVEHTPIPASRILTVRSRGDGQYDVIGSIRMVAGETLWWGVDLKGTQLAIGQLVDAMAEPTAGGTEAANLTISSYGLLATVAKFLCVLSGSATTTDNITVEVSISPNSAEILLISVPLEVIA